MPLRLGKQPPKHDPRTFKLSDYTGPALPTPPATLSFDRGLTWGMMGNDRLGDCTCAAAGHQVMSWTDQELRLAVPSDADVLDLYSRVNNGVDAGATCIDVLNEWRRNGLGSHRIAAYAAINPHDPLEVRTATWLFGGLYLGVALPLSAQSQGEWAIPAQPTASTAPGSWGGHCVPALGWDETGIWVITWGQPMHVSNDFFGAYCDEAYAVLPKDDWLGDVPGFNLAQLQADLAALPGPG